MYQYPNLMTEIPFSLGRIYLCRSQNCFPGCHELAVAAIRNGKKIEGTRETLFGALCGERGNEPAACVPVRGSLAFIFTEVNLEFPCSSSYKWEIGNCTHCLLPWGLHETVFQILSAGGCAVLFRE